MERKVGKKNLPNTAAFFAAVDYDVDNDDAAEVNVNEVERNKNADSLKRKGFVRQENFNVFSTRFAPIVALCPLATHTQQRFITRRRRMRRQNKRNFSAGGTRKENL